VHGGNGVSWERSRFRDDVTVADSAGLHRFLLRRGAFRRLSM
jgi:hypothetical protein